ncbi:MAG: TetR/AcrR family transcriptional regulator [Erysipelotrichaceae bacterium]|nr:TetR/AcrR family transcriptional regulator [Erysipelotrichaceae bacterium]
MIIKDFNIRTALLQSGKNEFLEHGFKDASLRTICRNAGLSTGSFYTHFRSKEELFSALVDPVVSTFEPFFNGLMDRELEDLSTGIENEVTSIAFAVNHRDEFRLLFSCSAGTAYENFRSDLINEVFYPGYQKVFDRYAERRVDPALVKIVLMMKFEEYMELIYGGYSMEEITKLITNLAIFSKAGFSEMLKTIRKEEQDSPGEEHPGF